MSIIFRSAGGPQVATTFDMRSAIRIVVRSLPDEFVSRLIVVFQRAAGVRLARDDLPLHFLATSATPPPTLIVSIAVIADEDPFSQVMGHRAPFRRVEVPAPKTAEAGSARSCSRGEVPQGGVQLARSASRKTRGRRMSEELQAEIVAAADALTESRRARAESSSLVDFKATLEERRDAFDRDAVSYFVFSDQIEYEGAGHPGSSDGGSEIGGESGAEGDAGYAGAAVDLTHAAEFVDSSDEDRVDAEGSSVGSFINTGALLDDDASNADGSTSE